MDIVTQIRELIIKSAYNAKSPHIGSALSIVEILYTLYFLVANISDKNYKLPERDRIILSKGHGSLALYATLALKNIIPVEYLDKYCVDGGILPCHIDMTSAKGLEVSCGSLGHGLGIAQGMALANRLKQIKSKVYVVIGDGEFQEGSVFEALNSIGTMNLSEITVIMDNNKFQASAKTDIVMKNNYSEIFSAFGFNTTETDGHNVQSLVDALNKKTNKPKAIIANTIKGKGISFMENTLESHYIKIDDEKLKIALEELGVS